MNPDEQQRMNDLHDRVLDIVTRSDGQDAMPDDDRHEEVTVAGWEDDLNSGLSMS